MTARLIRARPSTAFAGADEEAANQCVAHHPGEHRTRPLAPPSPNSPRPSPVRWLWPGWIPRTPDHPPGAFRGTGKSYFVLDARMSSMAALDDGHPPKNSGAVIYVDAELPFPRSTTGAVKLDLNRATASTCSCPTTATPTSPTPLAEPPHRHGPHPAPGAIIIGQQHQQFSNQNSVEDTQRLLAYLSGLANYADCRLPRPPSPANRPAIASCRHVRP